MDSFDEASSSCGIDGLTILCKKIGSNDELSRIDHDEAERLSSLIQAGDASRSDLEGIDTCGTLWNALVRVANILSLDNFESEQTNFPVHISRFIGAFLSTFETLLEASPNSIDVLLENLVSVFFKNMQSTRNDDKVVQLLKEYKDLFPFSYMFNRRSGKYPKSSFDTVNRHFKLKAQQQNHPQQSRNSSNNSNFDDEDTFRDEGDDDTLGDSFPVENFPSILAPSLMPLKPFNSNPYEDQQHHSSSQPKSNVTGGGSGREYTDAVQQHDSEPFSPDEASILDSYYNSWHRPSIEEDEEDSDQDHSQFMVKTSVRRATRMKGSKDKGNNNKATKSKPRRLTRRRPSTDPSDKETTRKNVHNKVTTKSVSFAKDTFQRAVYNNNTNDDPDDIEELRLEDDNDGEDQNQVYSFHLDEDGDGGDSKPMNHIRNKSKSPVSILRHSNNHGRQDIDDNHDDDSSLDLSDAERISRQHQEPFAKTSPPTAAGRRDLWASNHQQQKQQSSPHLQAQVPASSAATGHGHAGRRYEYDLMDDEEEEVEEILPLAADTSPNDPWQTAHPLTSTTSQVPEQHSPSAESKLTSREKLRLNMENFRRKKAAEKEAKLAQAKSSPVLHASLSSAGSSVRQRYAHTDEDQDEEEEVDVLPSQHTDKDDDHFRPTFITKSMRFLEENDSEAVSKSLDKLRNLGYKSTLKKPSVDDVDETKAPSLLVIETHGGSNSVNASFESAASSTFRLQHQQPPSRPRQGAETPTLTTAKTAQSGVPSWDSMEALQIYRGNDRGSGGRELQDSSNNAAVLMASTSQPVTIFDDPFQHLPANITLPALSEYAIATGVIFEGPLQKKSSSAIIVNRWQSRYLILKESTKCYCELQIFAKAVSSAWGNLPITKKASIPILDIASIEGRKNGREFTLHFVPKNPTIKESKQSGFFSNVFRRSNGGSKLTADNLCTTGGNNISSRDGDVASIHSSDASSVGSGEGYYGGDIKELTLQADTPETRMIWMIMLNQALQATRNEIE